MDAREIAVAELARKAEAMQRALASIYAHSVVITQADPALSIVTRENALRIGELSKPFASTYYPNPAKSYPPKGGGFNHEGGK